MFKTMFPFEFILMSMKILCPGFISTSVMKYPDKAREQMVYWSYSFRLQSIIVGKSRQDLEADSHII